MQFGSRPLTHSAICTLSQTQSSLRIKPNLIRIQEKYTWSEIADALKITTRTAQRIRQQAVGELTNMYSFADNVFRR